MQKARLAEQLKSQEGFSHKPYQDTVGKITIGYGRNLEDVGISKDEADILLSNDIDLAHRELLRVMPSASSIDEARQNVLVNMIFNIGAPRFLGFKKMIAAVEARNYPLAAKEMLDSKWAKQVGKRANVLAEQMKTGSYA